MKIILLQDTEKLGKRGDIVDIKPGYARNYLLPNKIALYYSPSNLRKFEEQKKIEEVRGNKKKREALGSKEMLESLSLTFPVQAGEDGKIFGAVTNINIAELLTKEGCEIDKKNILLKEPIKELGVYSVKVLLNSGVEATIKLWVVSK
ncbi:50S ribosomal protein L9 [candidate division WOR-3 bacterium]|nr:50S ribosomal protein L9 [candidate division WOR-3 bacterium]